MNKAAGLTLQGLSLLLLAWLTWQLLRWGVIDAVFTPDAQACQALGREAACWGVVAQKIRWLLWGTPEQWGGLPLTLVLFFGSWGLSWPLGVGLALGAQVSVEMAELARCGLHRNRARRAPGGPAVRGRLLAASVLVQVAKRPRWAGEPGWR